MRKRGWKKVVALTLCGVMIGNSLIGMNSSVVYATEYEEDYVLEESEDSTEFSDEETVVVEEDSPVDNIEEAVTKEQESDVADTDEAAVENEELSAPEEVDEQLLQADMLEGGTYSVSAAFEVLDIINTQRKAAGLNELNMDLNLYNTAQVRAKEITAEFSHTRPDGTGCFTAFPPKQVSMGENIARGYTKASYVMNAWMNSSEHKANILKSNYKSVGIACYYVKEDTQYKYYWVECFGDTIDTAVFQDGDTITTRAPAIYNGVDYRNIYDFNFYINKYSDIARIYNNNPEGALAHFVNYGIKEGRQGCEEFNVTYYKNRYVDLRTVFGNDLSKYYMHYNNYGKNEGRNGKDACALKGYVTKLNGVDYSAVYNFNYYVNNNSDAAKYKNDDIGALAYFVNTGMAKCHQASESFDIVSYAYKYYDLRKAFKNNYSKYYIHYMNYGKKEGRIATGITKIQGGLTSYAGVDYSLVYNVGYYANRYSDLRKCFGFDDDAYIKHFVNYGMKEGRQATETFNVGIYKDRYSDLQQVFGSELQKYYIHYINYGYKEGRIGK